MKPLKVHRQSARPEYTMCGREWMYRTQEDGTLIVCLDVVDTDERVTCKTCLREIAVMARFARRSLSRCTTTG